MGPYCGFCTRHCSVRYSDGTMPCVFEEAQRKKEEAARSDGGQLAKQPINGGTETASTREGNETA